MTSLIMDSPALQSSAQQLQHQHHLPSSASRIRAHNNSFSSTHSSVDPRGAIQKRHSSSANDRHRSVSLTQPDRLYRLATEQQTTNPSDLHHQHHDSIPPAALGVQWITPQHSPQLSGFAPEPSIEPFPQWTAPTPPRSDSGIPNVSIDSDEPVTTGISGAQEFAFDGQQPSSAEMSSLGFLLPTQYGASPYDSDPSSELHQIVPSPSSLTLSADYAMDQNYIPPMRSSQPPSTSGASAYAPTASSSPSLYHSRASDAGRRPSEMPPTSSSPYAQDYRRTSNPYEGAGYSVAPSQTIPSISGLTQSPLPSPHMGSTSQAQPMPQYTTRSPSMYEPSMYAPQPYTTAPPAYASTSAPFPQQPAPGSYAGSAEKPGDSSIRVLNQRPKPQCWEHGCNGRQFSTFSNLLRHQREKSGTAAKSYCPKCGAEFTRTTARNGHLAHDKCTKQRRPSDAK